MYSYSLYIYLLTNKSMCWLKLSCLKSGNEYHTYKDPQQILLIFGLNTHISLSTNYSFVLEFVGTNKSPPLLLFLPFFT